MPHRHTSSHLPFASLLSFRRREPVPRPPPAPAHTDPNLASLEIHTAALLQSLSSSPDVLSLPWLHLLLDSFLSSLRIFDSVILRHADDPRVADFTDISVKALDVINAVLDSLDLLRHRNRPLSIALDALRSPSLSDPALRRARKALADLSLASLLEDRPAASPASAFARRNRSFARATARRARPGHSRSLSWNVPRTWSAGRQLQAIAAALAPPQRSPEGAPAAAASFCMSWVLLFLLWVLVAAVGCQDKALQGLPPIPRCFGWAAPMAAVHDLIMEAARKGKGYSGLLKEVQWTERCTRRMAELTEMPPEGEKAREVREEVEEMAKVCNSLMDGLNPLEKKVREVSRTIVRWRSERLDMMDLPRNSQGST